MRHAVKITTMFAFLTLMPLVAAAQDRTNDHQGHAAPAAEAGDDPVAANRAAMDRMHEAMAAIEYTGDPDVDFARSMIPHHQAAIDMADILLEHGDDPKLKELAEEIIEAQEREIGELEEWLSENAR